MIELGRGMTFPNSYDREHPSWYEQPGPCVQEWDDGVWWVVDVNERPLVGPFTVQADAQAGLSALEREDRDR